MPPIPRALIPFRLKLLLGVFIVAGSLVVLMTSFLREALRSGVAETLATSMSTAAAGLAVNFPSAPLAPLADPKGPANPSDLAALQHALVHAREALISAFPGEWALENVDLRNPDLLVVVPRGLTDGVIIAATDTRMRDLPYTFHPETPLGERWSRMTMDADVVQSERGPFLAGRAPLRLPDQARPAALLVIEMHGDVFEEITAPLDMALRIIFAGLMALLLAVALGLAWWMNRPVRLLESGMDRVATGDLSVELPPPGRLDEFDGLVTRFNQMVLGLRDRRRLGEEMGLASLVQRRLLPRSLPLIPGYEVCHAVIYCDQTGGDALDCFELPAPPPEPDQPHSPRFALCVGDVSGHGIASALLMSWAKASLRAHAADRGQAPRDLLTVMNEGFVRDAPDGTFLTMFYAVLDPLNHTLTWASAGHEPAILLRASGAVERLASTGVPLGVLHSSPLADAPVVTLAQGDLLYIGTDGVCDTRAPTGELLGRKAVERLLREHASRPLPQVRDAIIHAAAAHRGPQPQSDDLTFFLLRRVRG